MKEDLIFLETAKLAKEVGFSLGSTSYYKECHSDQSVAINGDYMINFARLGDISNIEYTCYEAPVQSLLQKWLREKHDLNVEVKTPDVTVDGWYFSIHKQSRFGNHSNNNKFYNTYEEALEAGLQEALKLIKQKQ